MSSIQQIENTSATWVIGSGGLLGGAIVRTLNPSFSATTIDWSSPDQSIQDLVTNLRMFKESLVENQPWSIIWAAGHATVSSSQGECDSELSVFKKFLHDVARTLTSPGEFFLASSAGGVFAGSEPAPFNAESVAVPLSPYGFLKLEQERALMSTAKASTNIHPIIGRFSNLYGPGQDLHKLQGLISHLILAALTKHNMNIFVPLDTLRDFIYVDDAASVVVELLSSSNPPKIAIIASGEPRSLGAVISQVQGVLRMNIPISYGEHDSSSGQSPDLRMEPTLPCPAITPFPVGIKAVVLDLTQRIQSHEVN